MPGQPLFFQTDWHIQAFFMGIDRLCKKYSKETSQVRGPRLAQVTPILAVAGDGVLGQPR